MTCRRVAPAPPVMGASLLCVFALALAAPAWAQDAFERRHAADAARMTDADPIALSFATGGAVFRVGEPIPLSLVFKPLGLLPVTSTDCRGIGLEVILDHTDGTARPGRDYWDNGAVRQDCGVSGYYAGGRVVGGTGLDLGTGIDLDLRPPPLPPIRETVHLNHAVRFDRPGRYRFYLRTSHFAGQGSDGRYPRISNILTLDVVAADRAWEVETLAVIRATVAGDPKSQTRDDALYRASLLGTNDAVDVLLARGSGGASAEWLYDARDRGYVVRRLTATLDDAAQPVGRTFVTTLALLEETRRSGGAPITRAAFELRQRDYSARRLRVLAAAGRLDDELRKDMVAAAGDGRSGIASRVVWTLPAAGFFAVPDAVEHAILSLPPAHQHHVLAERYGWREFVDPAFLPMFRRMAANRQADGPQDLALAMWFLLAPTEARAFALRELPDPGSRIGVDGVLALPEAFLPDLDSALAARLDAATTPGEFARAMGLVERFATGAVSRRVRAAFERTPFAATCPQGPAALAYFFRVDPPYAVSQRDRVGEAVGESQEFCERRGVMRAVALRRMLPAVEQAALAQLDDPRPWVVEDALGMLALFASPAAEAPIRRAFERWHGQWQGRASELDARDPRTDEVEWATNVERAFLEALLTGVAWPVTPARRARVERLCLSRSCRGADELSSTPIVAEHTLAVFMPDLPQSEPTYLSSAFMWNTSRLVAHLAASPAGTTWAWSVHEDLRESVLYPTSRWLPGQEAAAFEAARRVAESRGMRLVRRP